MTPPLSPASLPLSPSTTASSLTPTNTNSNICPSTPEDDMTEDEVALMVKNALRKARKAMSSPQDESDDEEESALDSVSREDTATSHSGNDGKEEDLARRIEQEIQGARAFAEKVYYGGQSEAAASVVVAASSSVLSPSSQKSRSDDEVLSEAEEKEEAAVVQPTPSSVTPRGNGSTPRAARHTGTPQASSTPRASTPKVNSYTPNTNNQENTPPLFTDPSSPLKEPPRHHRQVVFRHPYPLPPPPILPRPDSAIIASNDVKHSNFRFKVVQPDDDLQALIQAATDESLVRRSNACGALKVLAGKESNRAKLCRTQGLLEALITAANEDAIDSDALDARTRAVTTLLYLAEPKDNRWIVCRQENLLDTLRKVIMEDTGEARLRACCTVATLAKTPMNRGLICSIEGLAGVLAALMVEGVQKEEEIKIKEKQEVKQVDTTESRDDSTMRDEDMSASYNSEDDDPLLTNTYSGTFSHGTGTFTDDQYYSSGDEEEEEEGSIDSQDDGYSTGGYSENESVNEEEGVEMQISSLKKLNIENHGDFLARSQMSACATLTHLTKHCANAPLLAQDEKMLENIVFIASIFDNPLHTRCIEILCNLTRFPSNNARLASNPKVVETLLLCGKSKLPEDRLWSIRTIQNLCSDAGSKVTLATGPILTMLSTSAMRKDYEEQYAAVGALMNLSTEPGSIVPLTNTKTVVATLVHLAHSPNTPGQVRKIACDSLATIGLWLQTLASAGTVPEEIPFSPLPTHTATGWLRWEN